MEEKGANLPFLRLKTNQKDIRGLGSWISEQLSGSKSFLGLLERLKVLLSFLILEMDEEGGEGVVFRCFTEMGGARKEEIVSGLYQRANYRMA